MELQKYFSLIKCGYDCVCVYIYRNPEYSIYQNMESQVKLYRTLYKYSKYSSLIKCGNRLCLYVPKSRIYTVNMESQMLLYTIE